MAKFDTPALSTPTFLLSIDPAGMAGMAGMAGHGPPLAPDLSFIGEAIRATAFTTRFIAGRTKVWGRNGATTDGTRNCRYLCSFTWSGKEDF